LLSDQGGYYPAAEPQVGLQGAQLLGGADAFAPCGWEPTWTTEDIALGYKLLEVKRAFRTLKSSLSLRPFCHSKDDRIRSHELICWLALLLVRIAELETEMTWAAIRRHIQRLHLGEFLNEKIVFYGIPHSPPTRLTYLKN